ncbi:hypothetical protein PCASD_24147 [Puccinia coronata f. sp. avenae]|uniref:Uncharacterized protein n=1 Tax=Puccinia coronata f. sp. avenae TaxID=200324 RepID=A0A2N5S057_9BASI|nr:hypothetical protein PCASD_24147 [Puccinia coronata f. sp. avenae]
MEVLFKNVLLQDTRHADKLLQALTSKLPRESQPTRKRQKRHDSPSRLSQYVRSLQFDMRGARPTGKRGGSLFCKILQHCPLLENLLFGNQLALVCKEPILEALASTPFIKEILLSNMTDREHGESFLQWKAHDVVSGLFSHWNGLETVEISGLTGWADNQTFPVLNCAIRTMILKNHNCGEEALSNLLKSCGESIRTLQISGPHFNLKPRLFASVLRDSTSPNLECLVILHPTEGGWTPSEHHWGVAMPGVLDTAFDSPTAFKNLKTLFFHGSRMATD